MNKMNLIIPLIFMIMMWMVMMITWINFHPAHLIMILIVYSMLISMNLSMLKKNFMYSIMMFLIMISGVLIIFLYFSSLISNEKVKSMKMQKLMYMNLILMLSAYMMWKFNFFKQPIMKCEEVSSINQIQTSSFNNLEMIYLYPFNSMSIISMMFLLISMLTIIKIISLKSSPLRKIK
nr:TPA_asm: NADH dehydrogenase subunit 6 [Pseudomyrmex feralis]